jgi:valyl-tRNA synthetase
VIRQLNDAAEQVSKLLDDYRYADAVDSVYHVIWDDVANWYLESNKESSKKRILA